MRFKNNAQRKAVMMKLVSQKRIPVMTGSLSKPQPKEKALAFRVWVHPKRGDDFVFEKAKLKEAQAVRQRALKSKKYAMVEPVIGVFNKKIKKYPKQEWWEAKLS